MISRLTFLQNNEEDRFTYIKKYIIYKKRLKTFKTWPNYIKKYMILLKKKMTNFHDG